MAKRHNRKGWKKFTPEEEKTIRHNFDTRGVEWSKNDIMRKYGIGNGQLSDIVKNDDVNSKHKSKWLEQE